MVKSVKQSYHKGYSFIQGAVPADQHPPSCDLISTVSSTTLNYTKTCFGRSTMRGSAPLLLLVLAAAGAGATKSSVVVTEEGSISGVVEETIKGRTFYSYYGVPFAKPPLGHLRLKDPEAGEKWQGVRNGSIMPQPCLQITFTPFILNRKAIDQDYIGEEDCLYLNVFTPKPGVEDERLPVMVWIHGGGFFTGGAHEYLPHALLEHDIVLVVLQYRLGIMGFLSTEDTVMPGNLGLKDQTLALHWVQNNIHNFGGDKTRVTIFGQSAGGASVHLQMLAPSARGLFSRAIPMSGSSLCPWTIANTHAQSAMRVASGVDCPTDQGSEKLLSCLQSIDSHTLVHQMSDLFDYYMLPIRMIPRVDGEYLPADPAHLVREGRVAQVDLMSGFTKDEGAFFTLGLYGNEDLLKGVNTNFAKTGPAILQLTEGLSKDPVGLTQDIYHHYFGNNQVSRDNADEYTKMISHHHFHVCQDLTAIHHAKIGMNTYRYEFEHRGQLSVGDLFLADVGKHYVCHGDELFYIFRGGPFLQPPNLPETRPKDVMLPDELALRDIITKLWTNFAATGQPTPDASLGFTWEAATPDHVHHLAINLAPTMKPDNFQEVRKFYSTLPTQVNQALQSEVQGKVEL